MESLIDNCWQFRSRQLPDTDYEILTSSLFTRTIGTTRFEGIFLLGLASEFLSDFHLARKRCTRCDIFFKLGKISRNIAFQLPRGQIKEIMVQKSTSRSLIFPSSSSRSSPVFSHLLGAEVRRATWVTIQVQDKRYRDCRGVKKCKAVYKIHL